MTLETLQTFDRDTKTKRHKNKSKKKMKKNIKTNKKRQTDTKTKKIKRAFNIAMSGRVSHSCKVFRIESEDINVPIQNLIELLNF